MTKSSWVGRGRAAHIVQVLLSISILRARAYVGAWHYRYIRRNASIELAYHRPTDISQTLSSIITRGIPLC